MQVRLKTYRRRKAYLEGMLAAESAKLESQARFIMEIIEKKLVISKPVHIYFLLTLWTHSNLPYSHFWCYCAQVLCFFWDVCMH